MIATRTLIVLAYISLATPALFWWMTGADLFLILNFFAAVVAVLLWRKARRDWNHG